MTTQDGTVLETTEYLPFGSSRFQSGAVQSAYRYTDQEMDAETGLYNYDARLYDPVIGRFITADSMVPEAFNPQTLNRYSYCYNNPLIYVDPTGHISWESAPTASDEITDGGYYNDSSSESSGSDNNEESTTAAGVAVTAGRLGKARTVAAGVGTAGAAGVGVMAAGMVLGMPSNTIVNEREELEMLSKAQDALDLDESEENGESGEESEGASEEKTRSPHPPAKRKRFSSKKSAREAAKKAGKGKKPVHHPDGEHGPHYHPDVPKPKGTPKAPNPHDHYYYPK